MDPKRKSRATLVEFLAQMVAAVEYIHKTSSLVVISFFSPSVSLVKRNQPNDIRPNPRSVAFDRFLYFCADVLSEDNATEEKLHS